MATSLSNSPLDIMSMILSYPPTASGVSGTHLNHGKWGQRGEPFAFYSITNPKTSITIQL